VATHFHSLKIKDIRKETEDCISISFEVPEELKQEYQFHHGQNITLKLTVDGEEIRRSYSICSSPYENELRVAVKKAFHGKFSSYAIAKLRSGDVMDVLPPTGNFYTSLQPSNKKRYLAFAAGSGITPIISIIKTTLATEPSSSFTLVYGNRTRSSIIFKEQLDALKNLYMQRLTIHHILSRENTEAPINYGRINVQKCEELNEKLIDIFSADEIFLCGPEEMIFGVKEWLLTNGVENRNVHFELFTIPGQASAGGTETPVLKKTFRGKTSRVTIKLDGVSFDFDLPFDGEPILDAALKQGADLPFACKGGVCSTCRAKLTEGEVEMETNYALERDEVDAGFILTCQSHPRTERVMINFDSK
jgi:ring-1,2-phenylacetyl-CoA epoxidase subunit PaaE